MTDLCIFDVCGTLIKENTTFSFCKFRNRKKSFKVAFFVIDTVFFKLVNRSVKSFLGIDLARCFCLLTLKGESYENINNDANRYVESLSEDDFSQEVLDVLSECKAKPNAKVVLASATIDPVCGAVARKLNVESYESSRLAFDGDYCKGKLDHDLLGQKKTCFLGCNIFVVVTDNKSDLDLCKLAKNVVAISKPKNLDFWHNSGVNNLKVIRR